MRLGGLNIGYSNDIGTRGMYIGVLGANVGFGGDYSITIGGGTISNSNADNCTVVGYNAAGAGLANSNTTIIGADSATSNPGANNTIIGAFTGRSLNSSSNNNIIIGYNNLNGTAGTRTNTISIGNTLSHIGDNLIQIGTTLHTLFYSPAIWNGTTSVGAANVNINSSGLLRQFTSSKRYKTSIEDVNYSFSENIVFNSRPVWFRSLCNGDDPNWSFWGFIAEEVADIDPRMVIWTDKIYKENENGEQEQVILDDLIPNSVAYDKYVVHLVAVAQKQKQEIDELKQEITTLKQRLDTAGIP